MVKRQHSLNATFHALADPTRRQIYARLVRSEASILEIAKPFEMSLPAVSKHLGVLRRAGLVTLRQKGRTRYCRAANKPLDEATAWMNEQRQFWESQLASLKDFLENNETDRSKDDDSAVN
ncbi:metalloregulator ArsR/SmtB family transcription factor [Candidatus Sumerlaeota bacterium]|nr:metalloregulator ArsR/SmtB family transcription factor [Candidatus Sumerlaeota bacterium]